MCLNSHFGSLVILYGSSRKLKSEIIMLIESIPRKSIETRIFVNELNKVVELI